MEVNRVSAKLAMQLHGGGSGGGSGVSNGASKTGVAEEEAEVEEGGGVEGMVGKVHSVLMQLYPHEHAPSDHPPVAAVMPLHR
jgi:hypothetical protein